LTRLNLFAALRSAEACDAILAIGRDFSPRLEWHGPACLVLDVSGLTRLVGDAHAIGRELERAAADCAPGVRIAVAPTQVAAKLLSLGRPGLTVVTGDAAAAIADLPIDLLRSLADDDRPFEVWARWGVRTLGEMAVLPSIELSARMGQAGLALQRLARGIDARPLVPDPGVPRFVESIELEWPIDELEPLSFVFARLLEPLSAALERADRGAAAIRLELRLADRRSHVRVLQLPAAMRDARVLRTLLLLDLESHPPPAAIDVVTIEVDPAPGRIVQYSLLERPVPSPETLATLTARLSALVGETRCGSPVLLDSYRPDGFELRPFDPARVAGGEPRSDPGPVLRRFRPPLAVRVSVERGAPVHVIADRRGVPAGRVAERAGPWRTSGAWWDAARTAWDRDEWDVSLDTGAVCRLFRDRVSGVWFVEGVLD
jgi:protein ImuB